MRTGKACGASYIHAGYECRIENGYPNLAMFKGSAKEKQLQAALESLEASLSEVCPYAQQMWRDPINGLMERAAKDGAENKFTGTYTGTDKVIQSVEKMKDMVDNYPKTIKMDNFEIPAPTDLVPYVSTRGEVYLKDPIFGERMFRDKDNPDPKSVTLEGKGASYNLAFMTGEAQALISFRESRGGKTSTPDSWLLPRREVSDKEVDEWMGKINPKTLASVAFKSDLKDHYKDPAAFEDRARNTVRSWLSYDGKSPATGRPINLPAVQENVGGIRPTIDHAKPFSFFRSQAKTQADLAALAENFRNLDVVEHNLNIRKSDDPWDKVTDTYIRSLPSMRSRIEEYRSTPSLPTAPLSYYRSATKEQNPSWDQKDAMLAASVKHRDSLANTYLDRISNPPGAPKINFRQMAAATPAPSSSRGSSGSPKPSPKGGRRINVTNAILGMSKPELRNWLAENSANIGTLGRQKIEQKLREM